MNALELKIPPALLVALTGGFMWLLATYAPVILVTFAGQTAIAIVIAIIGIQIAIAGARACYEHETTVNPLKPEESSSLITDGVFKVSRNPIYLGMALALLGFGVWLGALTALLMVPLFIWYLGRFQIAPEERSLDAQFGEAYRSYRQQTRRWL